MNPTVRKILAVLAGIVLGNIVNGGLISLSPMFVEAPTGVDVNDFESIKANFHLYEFKHFVMPFLAHALGTLVGAFVAAKIAQENQIRYGIGIGIFFLIGGIMVNYMIYHPIFSPVDIILAYIPMGWLGAKLANK